MVQLLARDVQSVLEAVNLLQTEPLSEPWTQRLLRVLPSLVPADFTSYNEIDLSGGPSRSEIDRTDFDYRLWPVLLEHMHEHPLATPAADGVPVASISDRVSRRAYERLGVFQEVYRVLKVDDQIVIRLDAARPRLVAMALSRRGWGFSGRERAKLQLLRPHLLNAQAAANAMRQLQLQAQQWKQTLDCLPHALIAIGADGRPLWQSDAARPLLEAYFPEHVWPAGALPEQLRGWFSRQWQRFEDSLAVIQPLVIIGDTGRLIVRPLCGPGGQRLLLLDEQPTAAAAIAQLRRLNLTPREAEVLHGVMRGQTNPQIAQSLDISARTAQKHVERIFAKLGVQTRTAAAARARELLGASLV